MKFVKKLLGENEVEAVLQRLDRLTEDEARTTAAHTLEVVYGLVQNMRVVIDGEPIHSIYLPLACRACLLLDGRASTNSIRRTLGTCSRG